MGRKKKIDVADAVTVINEIINTEDFSEVLKREFIRYANSVIEDRALPEACDGLKPSQRRVLVAMDDLNLKAGGRTVKCAKIAGDCSGNYHPHGEQVIYPTLVRMAQDWAIRYPLIIPQGNFGSLDRESSPAAMRYCLTGDSRIVSDKGVIPIVDAKHNCLVLSANNTINESVEYFDCGKFPVSQIITKHGYKITGTENHPLVVLSQGLDGEPILVWKLIKDIKLGDWVAIDRNSEFFPTEELNISKFHPIKENNRAKTFDFPQTLTADLAFIMGCISAEGNTSSKRIQFTNTCGKYAVEFLDKWQQLFGGFAIHVFFRQPENWSKQEYASLECHYVNVQKFLHNLDLSPDIAINKHIPQSIWESPKLVMAAYLRGLFEGDGSVENCQRNRRITLTTHSHKLAHDVQVMLLRFGMLSKQYYDKKRKSYRLCITGIDNLRQFAKEVGFVSDEKIICLNHIITSNYKDGVSHSDYIPYLSEYVRCFGKGDWVQKHNFDRLSRVNASLPNLRKSLEPARYSGIELLVHSNYGYSQVISNIAEPEEQNVYSIKVNSDCHSFVANGFINHNTEAKLSKYGEALLSDLSQDVVPYIPNYNEERLEPTILPSLLPNLLVNGGSGIAVGVAAKIPPHNLREVANVIEAYIKNNDITVEELVQLMPGPDFPTGGVLLGQEGVRSYYATGRGALQLEGVYSIEEGSKGTRKIVITQLPYGTSPEEILKQIEQLIKEKKIDGIIDLKDLSHKKKGEQRTIHVVIEVGKNSNVNLILNKILKHTQLRVSYNVNQTVLIDGEAVENASLVTLIKAFVGHRQIVLTKKFNAELRKHTARVHILKGLINVSKQVDAVIALIRSSNDAEDAQNNLVTKGYVESVEQAKAVLAITLAKLTKLESQALIDEQAKLEVRILELDAILADPKKILKIIVKEQQDLAKSIGDDRRTQIGRASNDIGQEDLIQQEEIIISLTKDGYIKRIPLDTYRVQLRGGKGVNGTGKKEDDEMSDIFVASTHDIILFFTNLGLVYRKKGYEIPLASRTAKGTHLANILALTGGERVTNMIPVNTLNQDGTLVFITTKGMIKRSKMKDYDTSLKTRGFPAIKLQEGDSLTGVEITTGKQDIFIITRKGKAIRYPDSNVRVTGRVTAGVRAFLMAHDDSIAQMLVLNPSDNPDILVVTEMGFGKRTQSSSYRCLQGRLSKGVNTIDKVKFDRNGYIIGASTVQEEDSIIMMTSQGKIIQIPVENVRSVGRTAMGVKMLNLDVGDTVTAVTKVENGAIRELITKEED